MALRPRIAAGLPLSQQELYRCSDFAFTTFLITASPRYLYSDPEARQSVNILLIS